MQRKFTTGDIVRHFKGGIYIITGIAKYSDDLRQMVVYHQVGEQQLWVRDLEEFISKVDKEKYPNILQEFRFEKIV